MYRLDIATPELCASVESSLFGLDRLSKETSRKIVRAWSATVASSEFEHFEDVPWDVADIKYTLLEHVNEVTRCGISFANYAAGEWDTQIKADLLIPTLILHDVDKPLMFVKRRDKIEHSSLFSEIPHGVVGGMLLRELDFPHAVVSAVTTHSPRMPFHGTTFEAFVLHYADHFCCDNAYLRSGFKPLYNQLEFAG